jgi:DNA modification methylase
MIQANGHENDIVRDAFCGRGAALVAAQNLKRQWIGIDIPATTLFVSSDYSSDALPEIESFFKRSHKVIVTLTVREILNEQIAKKLA